MRIFNWLFVVFWVTFHLYWAISARGTKKVVHRANRWVGFGPVVVALGAVLLLRLSGFRFQFFPRTDGVKVTGTVLCGLGFALAIWARKHLGKNWSRQPSIQAGHELVTSGPYQFVRHPIYTGILAAILGTALVVDSTLGLIMFVGIFLMFVWRVKAEEEFMMQLFPQAYPGYKKRTSGLVPFIW